MPCALISLSRSRSVMSAYHDPSTLLDTPLQDAQEVDGPEVLFAANPALLPPPGTRALVVLRSPTEDEAKEIARLEQELSK
jgi:hypothetical protein